jgi:hypothetical protein
LKIPVRSIALARQPENIDTSIRYGALREERSVDFHHTAITKEMPQRLQ